MTHYYLRLVIIIVSDYVYKQIINYADYKYIFI